MHYKNTLFFHISVFTLESFSLSLNESLLKMTSSSYLCLNYYRIPVSTEGEEHNLPAALVCVEGESVVLSGASGRS